MMRCRFSTSMGVLMLLIGSFPSQGVGIELKALPHRAGVLRIPG